MQTPHATGYLLAVALVLVCCWVNPNNAIPYRSRPRAKVQVDQWIGNSADARAVNSAHHTIGQPDSGTDKISSVSGGGKKWRTLQRFRSPRSRIKNANVNTNANIIGGVSHSIGGSHKNRQSAYRSSNIYDMTTVTAVRDVSKTNMEPALIARTINCSESHNANDRYSSSFNGNSTRKALNVGDDFQVAGEAGTKKTTSVHVGEDITLCWIETTTIKEDRSLQPVQRFVIREYMISFENSATIPERYLECVQLEGEIDGKNNSVSRSALFEIMDENTRHSHVVNFTTVSHSDGLTVWQHRRVRCGVGPVVTKNIIEWADERSVNTKKRVEIKVSPKIHRLSAQPTDTEPCTTDLVDPGLTSSTPTDLSSPVDCDPGIMCDSTSIADSTSSDLQDVTTQSYMTSSAAEASSELLSTGGMKVVTPDMINSSEEVGTPSFVNTETTLVDDSLSTKTPMEVTTSVDENRTTTSDFEISSSTESGSVLSVTPIHKTNNSIETGNQEVEMPESSEELNFSTSEIDNSCESGDLCADFFSKDSTSYWENLSSSEMEISDTVVRRDGETSDSEEFITTPTTDVTDETDETDYLSEEDWDNTIETTESGKSDTVTETIESNVTLAGVTEDENILTEIMDRGFTSTETTGNNTTESTVELTTLIECDPSSDDCLESFDITTNEDQTESTESLFDSGLREVTTTEVSTTEIGGTDEDKTNATSSVETTSEVSNTEESTTQEPLSASCESSENCDSSFEGDVRSATTEVTTTTLGSETLTEKIATDISNATAEVTEPETRSGDESGTEETITDISGATTEMIMSSTILGEVAVTEKTTTAISDASLEMTEPESRLGGESTTEEISTDTNSTEVTTSSTALSGEVSTGEMTTADIGNATLAVTEPEIRLGGQTTMGETTTDSNSTESATTSLTTLNGEASTEGTITDIGNATFAVTEPEIRLGGESTTEETTTQSDAIEVTMSSATSDGEALTEEITTDNSNATAEVTEPETRLHGETTTEGATTDISDATTEVITPSTTLGGEALTKEITADISDATAGVTEPETRLGGETTTENTTNDISDATTEVITLSTTLGGEITSDSSDAIIRVTAAPTRLNEERSRKETITSISDVTTEITESSTSVNGQSEFTTHTTDSLAEEITGTVPTTTIEQSDLGAITETIPDANSTNSVQYNHTPAIVRVIGTTTTTTDAVGESSTGTAIDLVTVSGDVETTNDFFTVSHAGVTPLSCDENSDDCTIGASSTSTTECDEESSSSCTATSDDQRYVTSAYSSEMCDKIGTGNCIMEPEITDLPPTISSTPFEVENISTTVSDLPTTIDIRESTTVKAMSRDSNPQNKLALTIKILLEHIDENQKKQKLVEVEKHLLFDEHPDQHDKQSLMKQVRSLNNTVSMRTVQALFNCSSVEKLTGDVGDFAAKYFTLHDDIPHSEGLNSNFSHTADLHVRNPRDLSPRAKREVDTNVEMSFPGIHTDIHSGLSYVMTQVSSEYGADQPSAGISEESIPRSRLLEVVANPRDQRVHGRRKRQTIEDLTIDQRDLPKDLEEAGHWSNERVRRATNGGRVRTLTEFTIYKGP